MTPRGRGDGLDIGRAGVLREFQPCYLERGCTTVWDALECSPAEPIARRASCSWMKRRGHKNVKERIKGCGYMTKILYGGQSDLESPHCY